MGIDLDILYAILADVARSQDRITYGQLSDRYYRETDEWHDRHGTWDRPLGTLNQTLHAVDWEPLSAVVVLQGDVREPGGGFWGSSPGVPQRPINSDERFLLYSQILAGVYRLPWPPVIPTTPPPSA